MASKLLPSNGENVMLEEAVNSVSYVRIGGKIRYFGEKGNAFLLTDEPPIIGAAQSMPNLSKMSSKECLSRSHPDQFSDDNYCEQENDDDEDDDDTDSIASSTSSIIESNAAMSTQPSASSCSASSCTSSPSSTPTGQGSPSTSPIPTTPSPMEVGLPLRLPRPPAAHLPPPLPSKPPSGPPSTATSTNNKKITYANPVATTPKQPQNNNNNNNNNNSNNSNKNNNKQNKTANTPTLLSLALSGLNTASSLDKSTKQLDRSHDNNGDYDNSQTLKNHRSQSLSCTDDSRETPVTKHPTVSSPTFFRSSGTLTVSISRDRSPKQEGQGYYDNLSPTPPLTPPTPTGATSGSSSSTTSSALVHLKKPFTNLIQTTMGVTGLVPLEREDRSKSKNTPSRDNRKSIKNGEKQSGAGLNEALANEQEGQRPATPDSGIDCQLDSKSLESKNKPPSLDVADTKTRSILPPELSSLCKGSVTVADLVAGAIVSYRNKPRDTRKGAPSTPKQQKAPPPPTQQKERTTTTNIIDTSAAESKSSSSHRSSAKQHSLGNRQSENADIKDVHTETSFNGAASSSSSVNKDTARLGYNDKKDKFYDRNTTKDNDCNADREGNHFNSCRGDNIEMRKTIRKSSNDGEVGDEEKNGRRRTLFGKDSDKKRRESSGNIETSKDGHPKTSSRESRAAKRKSQVRPRFEKGPSCSHCGKTFGIRTSRHHCRRCWRSFCEKCLPVQRFDPSDPQDETADMSRMCSACGLEHAMENSRGRTRGLWSEFEAMRKEARDNKGLEVTSKASNDDQQQTIHDLTLLLRKVCVTFLVELQQQLERSRTKTTTRLWESTTGKNNKGHKVKIKESNKICTACQRPLRYLTESRDCAVCGLHFCTSCVARTLQLYLPSGTKLGGDVGIRNIRFYIKQEEFDEMRDTEVSETYYTCLECEESADRFLRMLEFNQTIPDLETEMFDLQRHINHSLSYSPLPLGRQRCMSAVNLSSLDDLNIQDSNIKFAHRLYDRFLKLYGVLDKIKPATGIQMTLHRHIKQAMYTFYQDRRQQLQDILRRRGSLVQVAEFTG